MGLKRPSAAPTRKGRRRSCAGYLDLTNIVFDRASVRWPVSTHTATG